MFVDSHCHLDFPALRARLPQILDTMAANQVSHALCISVTLDDWPRVMETAAQAPHLFATVGTHPDYVPGARTDDDSDGAGEEPTVESLVSRAAHEKVVAIGETGLDYYRLPNDPPDALDWQRERFRTHIRAARACGKPLIVHTRSASADTLKIMREEGADAVGGVMHCFTETEEVARAAIDMGFYISFSGIVTFKAAKELKAVAQAVPLERMLIETDSPYLAPTPYRGKTNEPGYVKYVAEEVAKLKNLPLQQVAEATTENFFGLFKAARRVTA
jgi:TatD DNase family protein